MDLRVPPWARKKYNIGELAKVKASLRELNLHTVCESARCPNIGECFKKPTATFMILGDTCTRACRFCSVGKGKALAPDPEEPRNIAEAVRKLALRHAVITSVTRDDLPDGGAGHFAAVITALREGFPELIIEVLTPDFKGSEESIRTVIEAGPHIFNHNLETVPRLYPAVRPQAIYKRSLAVLEKASEIDPGVYTKSGIMVGLGETEEEVLAVMRDLREAGCGLLTIGQYLRPMKENMEVAEYVLPEVFERYADAARRMGFVSAASSPFVRSSYNAEEVFSAILKK